MNYINFSKPISIRVLVVLCVFLQIFNIGCSKLESDNVVRGSAVLRFKVEGANSTIVLPKLKSSLGNMVGLSDVEEHKENILNDGFALDIMSNQKSISGFVSEEAKEKINKIAADIVPLEANIRYRLLVYTLSNELVASIEAEVGKEQHISVTPGQSYKWRAYSYNTTTPMPTFSAASPVIETPTSTSLLFDKGDDTGVISNDGTVLPIVFKHQLTQINVQIGMHSFDHFRSVTEVTAEFIGDVIKKRSFNVFTGDMEGVLVPVDVGPLSFTSLVAGSNKTMIAKGYYTADPGYTSYSVKVNSLKIQSTALAERDLTPSLPTPSGGVVGQINFVSFSGANKGSILLGEMQISIVIPRMSILAISNNNWDGGYRLGPTTPSGLFLADLTNFGPNSQYVRTDGITVESINYSLGLVNTRFAVKTNYPDILYLACDGDYLSAADWTAVKLYLQRGGTVYHGQDNTASLASAFMRDIFQCTTGELQRPGQNEGTYKFTDTPEALADTEVLKGPFGDVTGNYWGQDRTGTVYFTNYSPEFLGNAIIYSDHAQNYAAITPLTTPRACYFRHKTLNYFFIGDGGFTLWYAGANYGQFPFRTDAANLPIVEGYGHGAFINSPAYPTVAFRTNGSFPIANSLMFGNLINQFINRVHYNGIDRTP